MLPLWLTHFVAPTGPPKLTARNLWDHVGATLWPGRKRKRDKSTAATIVNSDQCLQEAQQAGGSGAVHWFTRTTTPEHLATCG